jgi:hypothetical protein
MNLPEPGLYRSTKPYPGHEEAIPANVLVYIGSKDGVPFVVRPGANTKNEWRYGDPTVPLRSTVWSQTLKALPSQGFYTLPEEIQVGSGGVWRKNAVVQLGYNADGKGIIFVGERHDKNEQNVLVFSDKGILIEDDLLFRLQWAPILPVEE